MELQDGIHLPDADTKAEEDMGIESVDELIQRYFITVSRPGVTYEQRFQEGYMMLNLMAKDFDDVFKTDILSKLNSKTLNMKGNT